MESWIDGFAFAELSERQQNISQQREELEKQRKLLSKRKVNPSTSGGGGESDRVTIWLHHGTYMYVVPPPPHTHTHSQTKDVQG